MKVSFLAIFLFFVLAFSSWNFSNKHLSDSQFVGSRNPANILKSIKKSLSSAKNFSGKGVAKNPGAEIKDKIAELKDKLKAKEGKLRDLVHEKEDEIKEKLAKFKGKDKEAETGLASSASADEIREVAIGTSAVEAVSSDVVALNLQIRDLEKQELKEAKKDTDSNSQVCNLEKEKESLEEKISGLISDKEELLQIIVRLKNQSRSEPESYLTQRERAFDFSERLLLQYRQFDFFDRIERPMNFPMFRQENLMMSRYPTDFEPNYRNSYDNNRFFSRVPAGFYNSQNEYSFAHTRSILDYEYQDDLRFNMYNPRFYIQR